MSNNTNPGCLSSLRRLLGLGNKEIFQNVIVSSDEIVTSYEEEPEVLPYCVRDDFFSAAEASFYHVLKIVITDSLIICPKVALSEIFYVSHPNENMAYFNRINRKHVDYLLCDMNNLKPRFAIELDDSSHERSDRIDRDDFVDEVFSTAGLPLFRVPAKLAYDTRELAEMFKPALQTYGNEESRAEAVRTWSAVDPAPFCPKCGQRMVLRTATRGMNAGKQFYGCPNYPRCKQIFPLRKGV